MQKRNYFRNGIAITDHEALDPNGMIRSGVTMRVGMFAMDALQRSVANNKCATLTDGYGNGGLALNKPGYRLLNDASRQQQDARCNAAYAAYESALCDAYKNG